MLERRLGFLVFRNFVTSLDRKVTEMPLRWHQDHHSGGTINRIRKAERALFLFAQLQFMPIQIILRTVVSMAMLANTEE